MHCKKTNKSHKKQTSHAKNKQATQKTNKPRKKQTSHAKNRQATQKTNKQRKKQTSHAKNKQATQKTNKQRKKQTSHAINDRVLPPPAVPTSSVSTTVSLTTSGFFKSGLGSKLSCNPCSFCIQSFIDPTD
jgi:hypothetical protein